ncbi:MAG: hypothetical protein GC152_15025 [Alphaproteobacteria bacterium]|nr:hypothetical protein [Alphaproteobacteria bacterium]
MPDMLRQVARRDVQKALLLKHDASSFAADAEHIARFGQIKRGVFKSALNKDAGKAASTDGRREHFKVLPLRPEAAGVEIARHDPKALRIEIARRGFDRR